MYLKTWRTKTQTICAATWVNLPFNEPEYLTDLEPDPNWIHLSEFKNHLPQLRLQKELCEPEAGRRQQKNLPG